MNDATLKELKTLVERAVRPVRASMSRKRRMREELLAHLVFTFEEEASRGDEQAALERAKERFGNPQDLSRQFQETVPARSRFRFLLETGRLGPGETLLHFTGKHLLVFFISTVLVIVALLPLLIVRVPIAETGILLRVFAALAIATVPFQVVFTYLPTQMARALYGHQSQRSLRKAVRYGLASLV
jgi:hypothetical protein